MSARRGSTYRFVVDGPVSLEFADAFPDLVETQNHAGQTILEGPVVDPSQLAGIVSNICYRNTCIVRLEIVAPLAEGS